MTFILLLSLENQHTTTISLDISLQTPSSPLYDLPFQIQSILLQHHAIFQTLHGLPLSRPHDHHIQLFAKTPPIRCQILPLPSLQKTYISEMLKEGFIKPNTSSFSLLVLIVKKKDAKSYYYPHSKKYIFQINF